MQPSYYPPTVRPSMRIVSEAATEFQVLPISEMLQKRAQTRKFGCIRGHRICVASARPSCQGGRSARCLILLFEKPHFQIPERQIAILMGGAGFLPPGANLRAVLLAVPIGNIEKGVRFVWETLVVALRISDSIVHAVRNIKQVISEPLLDVSRRFR